jgi:competence protein ComEA
MPNRLMTNKEMLLIGLLAGSILLGAGTLLITNRGQEAAPYPVEEAPAAIPAGAAGTSAEEVSGSSQAERIVVEVKGAVREPGVYEMQPGQRVDDLLTAAGGVLSDADLSGINRAAHVIDATTLVVPREGADAMPPAAPGASIEEYATLANPAGYTVAGGTMAGMAQTGGSGQGGLVNINTASQAQLETLPRVGPVTARKIIEYRERSPFRAVEDLTQIHGIGEKTLENLRPHVTVR